MNIFSKTALAAGLAAVTMTGFAATAQASNYDRYGSGYGYNRAPQGHFTVSIRSCPDLREDRRDERRTTSRADRREDRRDRRVIECPRRAFDYVPTRREIRQGRTFDRLRTNTAYLDRRTGTYFAETRFGPVPVYIQRGYSDRDRRGYRRGYRDGGRGGRW